MALTPFVLADTYRTEASIPSVQVGASTILNARVAWKYDKRTTVHASSRLNPLDGSFQVDLGGRYRWGRLTSTGLAVAYGSQVLPPSIHTQGVQVKSPSVYEGFSQYNQSSPKTARQGAWSM